MSVLAVPVENTVRALRRLAPGAVLREPREADLGVLLRALRTREPAELASSHPEEVTRVVRTDQLRALARAMTGFFGAGVGSPLSGPAPARLVRAARYSGPCRFGELRARLRAEPGLRAAALGWAEGAGCRILGAELRGAPLVPAPEDGRRAAELAVAALLPRADRRPGPRSHRDDGLAVESVSGERDPQPNRNGLLEVRAVWVGEGGFQVDVDSDPPVDVVTGASGPTLRALWWAGLGRVSDDLGFEYLLLAKDPAGTGTVRHWCHPRPAPGARLLRLESAGYRGEQLRLSPASPGTSAEVLVRAELMVRLGT